MFPSSMVSVSTSHSKSSQITDETKRKTTVLSKLSIFHTNHKQLESSSKQKRSPTFNFKILYIPEKKAV